MPYYKCPIPTCNVNFEGSLVDITPQAIMHGEGSHQMQLSENDISKIIEKEACGETVDNFIPKQVVLETIPKPSGKPFKTANWWKK